MNKREQENREREKHEGREREKDERHHRERQHGTGYGTERAIYLEFLARRWQGSDPPTPQAYAQALKQLRELPGSIVTVATDLGTLPEQPSPDDPDHPSQKPANDTRDEERHS